MVVPFEPSSLDHHHRRPHSLASDIPSLRSPQLKRWTPRLARHLMSPRWHTEHNMPQPPIDLFSSPPTTAWHTSRVPNKYSNPTFSPICDYTLLRALMTCALDDCVGLYEKPHTTAQKTCPSSSGSHHLRPPRAD